MYKQHTNCRACGNPELQPYLDLGEKPLSNNLLSTADEKPDLYPLKVLLCPSCGLSQLSVVVDPSVLFGHYVYRSSISQGYKDHCRAMAKDLEKRYSLNADSFHIDIAGNDGALLNEFKSVLNYYKCLNVDPAVNLAPICEAQDIRVFTAFWGVEAAKHLALTYWPKANLITATNVFAHVDNVYAFLEACRMALAKKGVIILEFPYLKDFIDKKEFDTVYFEHLSYFSINPLWYLCRKLGLELIDVQHFDIHGGSVRCHIAHSGIYLIHESVDRFMVAEDKAGFDKIETYREWAKEIHYIIYRFEVIMKALVASRKKIYGFAASAKGNTLLNCAGITPELIPYIIDETPEKIGKYSPGTGIPIEGMERLIVDQPDYLVILSWNFTEEIVQKTRKAGYKGRFLLPLTCEII